MKKFVAASLLMLNFVSLASLPALAKSYYYKFNENDSKINFYISSTLHSANGEAKKFKGYISLNVNDNNSIDKADGLLEINTGNLNTNQNQRDTRLKSEILSVTTFPRIKLKVNKAKIVNNKVSADGTLYMHLLGTLTIRDVTKNVDIPAKVKVSADRSSATVEGKYTVNFKEFNVPDPSLPIVGKVDENIQISFNIKAY